MYQNGKRVNRHAAMRHHKNELKRRHTPINYRSYYHYCLHQEIWEEHLEMWLESHLDSYYWERHMERRKREKKDGVKQYYQRWWKGNSCSWISSSNLTDLKRESHREIRRDNHRFCKEALEIEDLDDLESERPAHQQGGDRWDYI